MMQGGPKINLIYIASIGRSGTTLLESMLGAHSQIATCGEVHIWPHEILQGGVLPCSCGQYVDACTFWSEVCAKVNPLKQPAPRIHFFREAHNAGRTLRIGRLSEFGKNALAEETSRQVQTYGVNNYEVYRTFLDQMEKTTGCRPEWVVDASKDPYRLLWLVRSGLFNIKVLHNVKDPRAFVYSVTKPFIHYTNGYLGHKRLYYTARQSLAWSIQNHLISAVAQNHLGSSDYLLVHYEKLASSPKTTFKRICDVIGCDYEEYAVENFREGSVHTIAGNPMRYETKGIVLDEKWRHHLPQSSRKVAELVTTLNRSRYGYD